MLCPILSPPSLCLSTFIPPQKITSHYFAWSFRIPDVPVPFRSLLGVPNLRPAPQESSESSTDSDAFAEAGGTGGPGPAGAGSSAGGGASFGVFCWGWFLGRWWCSVVFGVDGPEGRAFEGFIWRSSALREGPSGRRVGGRGSLPLRWIVVV